MKHKYGEYTEFQIGEFKKRIRKTIFLLLLCVDPKTAGQFKGAKTDKIFEGLLYELGGASDVFFEPAEIVEAVNLLERAKQELRSKKYDFQVYRKLILDAGACIDRIKEV